MKRYSLQILLVMNIWAFSFFDFNEIGGVLHYYIFKKEEEEDDEYMGSQAYDPCNVGVGGAVYASP
jgi:hypothetical protein